MKTNQRKISDLTEKDFLEQPVWTWADEDDESLVEPVLDYDPLPEDQDALFVAARLTLANGRFLNGSVAVRVGDQRVYLMEIFLGTTAFDLPLLNRSDFAKNFRNLADAMKLTEEQILPLQYETDVHFEGELPISGEITGPIG